MASSLPLAGVPCLGSSKFSEKAGIGNIIRPFFVCSLYPRGWERHCTPPLPTYAHLLQTNSVNCAPPASALYVYGLSVARQPLCLLCKYCTFNNSLRSEISSRVRLAISWTNCWILGEYSLGALSRGGLANASHCWEHVAFSILVAQARGWCCLHKRKKWNITHTAFKGKHWRQTCLSLDNMSNIKCYGGSRGSSSQQWWSCNFTNYLQS